MERDVLIKKLLLNIRECKVSVLTSLEQAYTAGWESRNKQLADQRSIPIQQLTREGKLMMEYHNIQIASRKARYSRGTIYTSLKTGKPTRRGHIWKYKEDKEGNDRDTDTGGEG